MSLLLPVKRARRRSLWLQEALAREPEAETVEPLSGGHRTDVCVVGGGYTGLWTALQIKWLDPSVEVMLLEADICGGGASGRNGGGGSPPGGKTRPLRSKKRRRRKEGGGRG